MKGLGYYGASFETTKKLDFEGRKPLLPDSTNDKIVAAIAENYPDIKDCSERDRKAIIKWVINEG